MYTHSSYMHIDRPSISLDPMYLSSYVRGKGEEWVRIWLEKGDLIVLPAGIWHRFTVDGEAYTRAVRLFKDEPKWTPLSRQPELEENEFRRGYKECLVKGEFDV